MSGESVEVSQQVLVCQVGSLVCALSLENISETMRPLPIEPVIGMPPFIAGISVVRGAALPVVDLAKLLGDDDDAIKTRFVVVSLQQRKVALSVQSVLGIRRLATSSVTALPPLLRNAHTDFIGAVGSVDAQLLIVLRSGWVLPDEVWAGLSMSGGQA